MPDLARKICAKGATDEYRTGRPLRELQHLLGHKSVKTTEIYLKELVASVVVLLCISARRSSVALRIRKHVDTRVIRRLVSGSLSWPNDERLFSRRVLICDRTGGDPLLTLQTAN